MEGRRGVRHFGFKLVIAVLAVVLSLGAATLPAHGDAVGDEFVAKINALRVSKGLGALHADSALTSFAQSWSDHMAAAGTLSHNPALVHSPGEWTKAGENVGVGSGVDTIFAALVASPRHYQNMVDPSFTLVGIGVTVLGDGTMYTTQNFEARPATPPTVPRAPVVTRTTTTTTLTTTPPPTAATPASPPVRRLTTTAATHPATPSTSTTSVAVYRAAAAPAPPPPPPPPPVPVVPVRIALSLDQLRGLDPIL
jgi:hypothetical protein